VRAKRTSVSCVNSGENLRVWSASFEFEGLVLPKLPDGRVNEKVRQLLERKIAQAIASLDFDLGEPSEDQRYFDALREATRDTPQKDKP
jgi:hypothetical protein